MADVAASCPISNSQFPYGRQWGSGDPRSHLGTLQDLINTIPRAHDLPSAIQAINIMNSIISRLTRGEPQVNNTYVPGTPSVILKGQDNNPHYGPADWMEESRHYRKQKLFNPDDPTQFIVINVLNSVMFYNPNTNYRLQYYEPKSTEFTPPEFW